ncbi:ATP-binding protein [Conyzicola nivalis]|uniref:Two-component system sensor kinase n=1 Tax=Conyzicola nivalis TaxID=1477021 RepID=A0A916WK56_9MICO|nr:ATP-binding protein [Conyzicola nivalis]GGB05558.1 putative two-component system sensor kinase [Conyzicola nivalis]
MKTATERPPLARPRRVAVGGVCLAVARHLDVSVRRVRFLTVALALCGGGGVLLYLWLWAFVPLDPAADDDEGVRRSAPATVLLLVVAGLAALVFLVTGRESTTALLFVTCASGLAVAWSLTFDRHDPDRGAAAGTVLRFAAVVLLVVCGVAALLARPTAENAVLGVAMVVLGVAVIAAPRVVALSSDLQAARTARVREEQRAEIAAHLHDSVLQTLALIQNRAGASSEVARIARAQERELRDWLFVGDAPVVADLATELRDIAAAIELDYAVRIDVVTAGESVDNSSGALLAAAREAMLNAARHAGGEVSVYVETPPGAIDVFVRDRGPGVDLQSLPADRLGIRESIIGRMSRAGGIATVRPGTGGSGTEVHLHLEVPRDIRLSQGASS